MFKFYNKFNKFQFYYKLITFNYSSQQEMFIEEMFENISPRVLKYKE